ncbi:MAG: hypothetical protein RDU83_09935 [bacterium]|nr:hypothetical protein [bacterium]
MDGDDRIHGGAIRCIRRVSLCGRAKNARSTVTQTIILTAGSEIDAGAVTYRLYEYLGTCEAEDDQATVLVTFQTGAGVPLGEATIGPVTSDHFRNKGGLLRAVTGTVPRETRRVVVNVIMTRLSGSYNDGSADNLVFELVRR